MKGSILKSVMAVALLLLAVNARAAGTVTFIQQLDGTVGTYAQDVKSEINEGVCTLTISNIDVRYTISAVTVTKIVSGTLAQGRRHTPNLGTPVEVTKKGEGVYTFNVSEDFDYEATIDFTFYGFGLKVNDIIVTGQNMANVLGDDKVPTVVYNGKGTLILNGAANAGLVDEVTITCSRDQDLTIYLKGDNGYSAIKSIECTADAPKPRLIIDTDPLSPAELTIGQADAENPAITGFSEVVLENDLIWQQGDAEAKLAKIGAPLPVIAAEETVIVTVTPDADELTNVGEGDIVSEGDGESDKTEVMNKVVDAVLYTLVVQKADGTENEVLDDDNAVVLNTVVSDADLESAQKETPGTDEYAKLFSGVTLKLAAGSGTLILNIEVAEGNKLMVVIGDGGEGKSFEFTNVKGEVEVPYVCEDFTYVYIYNGTPAPTSARGDHRAKVLTTPVKIISVGVAPASVQQTADPAAEPTVDNQLEAVKDDDIDLLGDYKPQDNTLTELADAVFAAKANDLSSIDLSETAITGVDVNRTSGPFEGVSTKTFIYLPAGNTNTRNEPNVVIGAICNMMQLTGDDKPFKAPMNFGVKEATLDRSFVEGRTSTVYLPFAVSQAAADALGTFYTFQGVNTSTGDADLEPVTTGLAANTPYIFQKNAGGKVTVNNVSVYTDVPVQTELIGTYEPIVWSQEKLDLCAGDGIFIYGFAASDQDDNIKAGEFVRVGAGASIKPYRAYLQLTKSYGARIAINWGDEATGITNMNLTRTNVSDGIVYDLQGRKVRVAANSSLFPVHSSLKKGLYIQNGRKVLVR